MGSDAVSAVRCFAFSLALLTCSAPAASTQTIQHGLRAPAGFEITEFADSQLANDIVCMTLDPKGRVVVSGRGYLRILVDDDGVGRADRAIDLASAPKDGAQGMLWEGDSFLVMGDGGIHRLRMAANGDQVDVPSQLIRAIKSGGEHDGHALRRGPDGWLYVLCGNNAGIDKRFAQLATSPIRDPVAGCVLRFSPDLQGSEIVADGFRNPYGMDFNSDGELFTFDSDNERCVSLPWYEPIRFYHVLPGGHYGWQSPQRAEWWRQPPYFCDVVAPVATTGRGSPTGVVCYRHVQFPEHYRGGFFLADWTFGRIYFVPLERFGTSYTGNPEVFLEADGDNGFAPTAMVLHPVTGDLYIAIGGRGTRGAVYRVRFPHGMRGASRDAIAALQPKPRSLEWQPEFLQRLPQLATRPDLHERRRALEAIVRFRTRWTAADLVPVIDANCALSDRHIRQLTAQLRASLDPSSLQEVKRKIQTAAQRADWNLAGWDSNPGEVYVAAAAVLPARSMAADLRLLYARLLQRVLGDLTAPSLKGTVWEGYSPRDATAAAKGATHALAILRQAFPSGDADVDREVSRALAMLEDDDPVMLGRIAQRLTADSPPIEDIHYLIVLARLRAPRKPEHTRRVADALLALDTKLARQHAQRDRHWPLRMAELHVELARKDHALNAAILAHPDFGRPDHALFAQAPGFDRPKAAAVFLANGAKVEDYPWSPALVDLLGALPFEQSLPVLRRLWDKGGLEEECLRLLARQPQAADRGKFVQGLQSPQLAMIRLCLDALEQLPPSRDGQEALALVRSLRALPEEKEANPVRERLVRHLERTSGHTGLGHDKAAWSAWFAKSYPDLAARLGGADGVDVASWNKRLATIDWSTGDLERGRTIFTKASCAACHSGTQALGPDLRGVAKRFSRDDLFTAIIQPSKDISPRYRTTLLATGDGKVYQGLIIYEAVDSVILQTGPAITVRLAHQQIVARRFTDVSLMPPGLLDKFADREIADLYVYLRSLTAQSSADRR